MRTFPRELATFRQLVEERAAQLRQRSFESLLEPATMKRATFLEPVVIETEDLTVGSRDAIISTWVRFHTDGTLGVVLQGFMDHRFMPGKSVALDGFCRHPDGSVSSMPEDELDEFE